MYDNALERYNEYIEIYFDKYKALLDAQGRKLGKKIDPINLILATLIIMSCLEMMNWLI